MALEQLKIREIVKQSVSKNVDIPEFQREFVWDPEQVKLLAGTLYRDYPVGSFLLWDSSEYREAKTAQGTHKIGHEVEDVAEIFARLNREGTRVKEADVVLALAAVRNPGWAREEYLPFRNDLEDRGWDLNAGVFIRAMTGIGHGRARLIEVPKNFWNPDNLPSVWEHAKRTIIEVQKRLAEFGVFSPDLLPSTNSLIPLLRQLPLS